MRNGTKIRLYAVVLTLFAAPALASASPKRSVDSVLNQLKARTARLKTYQAGIVYTFKQPLLDSQALRRGAIFYAKANERAYLRINFQTLKQDDEQEQQYEEHFIFDGVWLTHLNFPIKAAKRHQLAEEDKPADAFALASRNLPVIGFTRIDDLKRQFEISLVDEKAPKSPDLVRLHLKTRPDSRYKDDYVSIDFWVNMKIGLPAKIVALNQDEEVYEIKLIEPKINEALPMKRFEFNIPDDFGPPEVVPLSKKAPQNK